MLFRATFWTIASAFLVSSGGILDIPSRYDSNLVPEIYADPIEETANRIVSTVENLEGLCSDGSGVCLLGETAGRALFELASHAFEQAETSFQGPVEDTEFAILDYDGRYSDSEYDE